MEAAIVLGVLILGAAVIGGGVAYALSRTLPTPENRPAPPLTLEHQAAREAALRRIAARRVQEQREASARITRGW